METKAKSSHYKLLVIMAILSFVSMYILMYAMVDSFSNVLPNLNQFYMAALMTSPMIIIEVALMGVMYTNKKWNILIIAVSSIALVVFFLLIRQQVAISDKQFLQSMIPHHAGAILMCKEASLEDEDIKELCKKIISSQQAEIDIMKMKLDSLEN